MSEEKGPDATSGDYDAMRGYWDMVETLLNGADAMRVAGEKYLPKFPNETADDYKYRRENAKFTNIYADIVNNLAAKPFSDEVKLDDKASESLQALAEDIDGRGNHLHVFAANTFFHGINNAIDWILVEFSKAKPGPGGRPLTQAEEKTQGLRPYWVHIPAKRMLAVHTAMLGGKEVFVHARFREDVVERSGYAEVTKERVRVLNRTPMLNAEGEPANYEPATYELFEKRKDAQGKDDWVSIAKGPVTIGVIPLVPFVTGRRKGGSWQFVPPMKDAAFLQVEHYQQETALKSIKELTAFPMLAGNGVAPAMDAGGKVQAVPVGPRSVLYAPPTSGESTSHGEWKFIEPTAASLKFLAEDVSNTEQQLREIGRQPLTAQTGNLTVVTTAFAAQKGNSAIQAWALNLKDALEQAFKLTALWLKEPTAPTVRVFTDFDIAMHDEKGPETLISMRAKGDLSQETLWEEMQRRGVLSADFDPDEERKRIEEELPDPDDEANLNAALGGNPPVDPNADPNAGAEDDAAA